jgi:hypothetical protein
LRELASQLEEILLAYADLQRADGLLHDFEKAYNGYVLLPSWAC